MKRLITFLLLLVAVEANAQVIYWWEDSQFVGNLRTNVNKSFSNVVAAIASASGGAQSPFTNDLDAAGNTIENLDSIEATNTIFIRLQGTSVLAIVGNTNISLNGRNLMDGTGLGSETNLPTYLIADAGNTVTVSHADNLFSTTATTTPWTVTVNLAALGTGEVWTALLEVNAGTNSVGFPTNTINNVGRASSTNLQISTTIRTEILLQKPLGSPIVYPVQLTP